MKIAGVERKKIIIMIVTEGGRTFLESLRCETISHDKKDVYCCPACKKNAKSKMVTYAITNPAGFRFYDDRFNRRKCVRHAIAWLYYLYGEFQAFLDLTIKRELTTDDLLLPLVQDKLNKFNSPRFVKIQSLTEFASNLNGGDDCSDDWQSGGDI
jgi:hypothetical protein